MKTKIKVLHFVPNLDSGGTENFVMNMYKNIDRDKVQFDFVVHTNKKGVFEEEIERLGGTIYRFPVKDNYNLFKYIKDLNAFFKEHKEYKIIHGAMPSIGFIYLGLAKKNKVPVRIAHSHTSFYDKNIKGYIKHCSSKLMKYYSNINLACSMRAGKYLFGHKPFTVIHNAIDLEKYYYSEENRAKIRKQLNIPDNKIVLGHVGRLSKEKNHRFLIELMKNLDKQKYTMIFVGGGPLEAKLKKSVRKNHLEDSIIFLGVCNNVNEILSAFDLFLLPSLFEGLPTVAIESQTSSLPCIISSKVTDEVIVSENVKLVANIKEKWLECIEKTEPNKIRKPKITKALKSYDIKTEAQKLLDIYEEKIKDGV